MMIELSPNYELFIQILLGLWVLRAVLSIICGILESEKLQRDRYGGIEIIEGGIFLLLAVWVMIG